MIKWPFIFLGGILGFVYTNYAEPSWLNFIILMIMASICAVAATLILDFIVWFLNWLKKLRGKNEKVS